MSLRSLLRNLLTPARKRLRVGIRNETNGAILAEAADVADDSATRRRGLLKHSTLAPGQGLWIVPCSSVHSYGMRFDIDLVYVDRKRRVRKVRSGMKAGRMSMCLGAHSVLELPSGTIDRTKTERGHFLQFTLTEV